MARQMEIRYAGTTRTRAALNADDWVTEESDVWMYAEGKTMNLSSQSDALCLVLETLTQGPK